MPGRCVFRPSRTERGSKDLAGIVLRGRIWHFRWVVPKEYLEVAGKKEIHRSLKTDSRSEAHARALDYERELRSKFEAILGGQSSPEQQTVPLDVAIRIAQGLGVPYKSAKEIAAGRIEDILSRIETTKEISPDARVRMH